MRWGLEKRLQFIEFRIYWEGGINRADLIEQFGISVPQASKDLNLYEEKAPGNLAYDKSKKRYLASADFKPAFLVPKSNLYLAQLQSANDHTGVLQEAWLSFVPDFDAMPMPRRRINAEILRSVVAAIRNERSLEVEYQSMNANRSCPQWRWITPHALGSDGLRWHVRAFCHFDEKFKDFILSRCSGARNEDAPGATAEVDIYWREKFDVLLVPNPVLKDAQRQVIEQDYEMQNGELLVSVRKALLYYFQKRLRFDVSNERDQPHETPVVISNRAEFDSALAEAMS